jgi:hypothetical protein
VSIEEIVLLIAVTAGLIGATIYRSNKMLGKLKITNTDSKKKDSNR